MKRRTLLAAASAAFFSSGCGGGGGGGAAPRVLALHGDSLSDGTTPGGKLAVIPGQRLAELLPDWDVRDYATAAETLPEAYGETVYANGVPLPANRLKFSTLPEHIAASDATHMLFRYGGADCLLGTPLGRFSELLDRTVELARKRNKKVLLAGVYDHPSWNLRAYTDAAREVAAKTGATWIEMPAIRYPEDLTDDLHPTQEMSDRWCQAIAEAVRAAA